MIAQRQEQYVNDNLCHANMKQCQYNYALGQQILKKVYDPTKLGVRTTGPYTIKQAHVNGMLTIELHAGLTEHLNMYNGIPYH